MLADPRIKDPTTPQGKKLRCRFRVPFPVFTRLLEMAQVLGFAMQPVDCCGQKGLPLELKVLGVLRVLGRATCFDGIEELSLGSAEAHRSFFHEFNRRFVQKYFDDYVYTPRNAEETRKTMAIYKRLGIPGAIGSTDCVHVKWERCPTQISNACTGKEGYSTLAWQATVDHHKRFLSVTKSFFGSANDNTICKFDNFMTDLRSGAKYGDVKFNLYNEDGEVIEKTGAFTICDGGFMKWRSMICPYRVFSHQKQALWSAQLESTRKDVECAFGILKGRFRCLKLGVLFQHQHQVDDMFHICIILHNMILEHDGRDSLWENDVEWTGADGQHDVEDEEGNHAKMQIIFRRGLSKLTDWSSVGRRCYVEQVEEEADPRFYELRKELAEHYFYKYRYLRNELEWLN